jgi:hypothetical protein
VNASSADFVYLFWENEKELRKIKNIRKNPDDLIMSKTIVPNEKPKRPKNIVIQK